MKKTTLLTAVAIAAAASFASLPATAQSSDGAELTEEELQRMSDDHQQEFSQLEESLKAEKDKQIVNLKDRIAKRRSNKKKQMEAEGAKQAEVQRMEEEMAQEELVE